MIVYGYILEEHISKTCAITILRTVNHYRVYIIMYAVVTYMCFHLVKSNNNTEK